MEHPGEDIRQAGENIDLELRQEIGADILFWIAGGMVISIKGERERK